MTFDNGPPTRGEYMAAAVEILVPLSAVLAAVLLLSWGVSGRIASALPAKYGHLTRPFMFAFASAAASAAMLRLSVPSAGIGWNDLSYMYDNAIPRIRRTIAASALSGYVVAMCSAIAGVAMLVWKTAVCAIRLWN